jgi:hypothetical protein
MPVENDEWKGRKRTRSEGIGWNKRKGKTKNIKRKGGKRREWSKDRRNRESGRVREEKQWEKEGKKENDATSDDSSTLRSLLRQKTWTLHP